MQPGVHTAENSHQIPWAPSQCKDDEWMEFLITNIRWLRDHLIFIMEIPILVKLYLYTEMVPLDPGLRPLCNNLDDPKPEIKIYKNGCLHTHTWLQGHIMDKTIKKNTVKQQNLGLMGIMAQSYPVQIHYETRKTRTPAFWDTPCRPMITHTSDSHQTPSQNKTKSKLQI